MEIKEMTGIVTLIKNSYPNALKDTDISKTAQVWMRFFAEYPIETVLIATEDYVSTCKFPPCVADIKERIADMLYPEVIPPDVAWSTVSDVLFVHGGENIEAGKFFPPIIAGVIDSIGWKKLCELQEGDFLGGRRVFSELYRDVYKRKKEEAMRSKDLREKILKIKKDNGTETYEYIKNAKEEKEKQKGFWSLLGRL